VSFWLAFKVALRSRGLRLPQRQRVAARDPGAAASLAPSVVRVLPPQVQRLTSARRAALARPCAPENIVHQTMSTRITQRASSASSRINHMVVERVVPCAAILGLAIADRCRRMPGRRSRSCSASARCGLLASAAGRLPRSPAPARHAACRSAHRARPLALGARGLERPAGLERRPPPRSLAALRRGCDAAARLGAPGSACAPRAARAAGRRRRRAPLAGAAPAPYRVEPPDGASEGLITGYFEPLIEARASRAPHRVPLHAPPADLASAALVHAPADRHAARRPGRAARPRDRLRGRPAGRAAAAGAGLGPAARHRARRPRARRCAWPSRATTTSPTKSVGRWLIDQGELRAGEASWPAIKAWARRQPAARARDAVGQPARGLLPRRAAARPGARPARRAGRAADAGALDRRRPAAASPTARRCGSTPPSRCRPRRCAAW
jgi:membrane-bound lytic murein transglycosylase A